MKVPEQIFCVQPSQQPYIRLPPTLTAALHKAGMSMHFPRDVLFGPPLFQGYQLQYPFFTQQTSHITTLLQESVHNSHTHTLLQLTAECLMLQLGISFELGVTPYQPFASYVTDYWYKSLWKFGSQHPLTIREAFLNVMLLCGGDQFLM